MLRPLSEYKTLVFDCDGVVLNSNKIKTQAFYDATAHFGKEYAEALVDYHVNNGGISRIIKFEYFIKHILGDPFDEDVLNRLVLSYGKIVKDKLMQAEVAKGLDKLRKKTKNANWLIVSGGAQDELREVFHFRNIDKYFDGGIFGNPDNKEFILTRELENGNIKKPAVYIGDSKYDYLASKSVGLDFIFLSKWTEVQDYRVWCKEQQLVCFENLFDILFL